MHQNQHRRHRHRHRHLPHLLHRPPLGTIRAFLLLGPSRKRRPFIVCPVFEEGRVRERMEAKPATLPSASTTRVYTWNEDEDPYKLLAKALKESGIATGKIGIEERTQFVFADGIAHASPALTATSATPITFGCRSIKTPAELALMQLANNITLSVYKAAYESAQPGMTNRQFTTHRRRLRPLRRHR